MKGTSSAKRDVFLETFCKHLLFLLVISCIAVAQYSPPYSQSYPTAVNSYAKTYQPFMTRELVQSDVKNCTDLTCGMEQCCIETPRAKICVPLTIINTTTNERMCVRPKLCSTDYHCFQENCCVYNSFVTSDTTCSVYPDYYKYPPHSFPGQIVKPTSGICLPKPNIVNATCFLSITQNQLCPCGMTDTMVQLVCLPLFAGNLVGTCQIPA